MKANLSTFDVFDTAVTRTVFHPDHLHWLVGAYLGELKYFDGSADAWRAVRIEAERTARLDSSLEEVTLAEIYRQMSVRLGWGRHETERAMDIELSAEIALSRSVHSVLEDYRRASKQSIGAAFISDTYFDKPFVAEILGRSGYAPSPQQVFVSSEFGKTKHSGNLYREVIAATAARPGAISHTGDNFYSDITVARRHRLRAKHFEESRQNGYERAAFDAAGADCIASVIAGSARAARLAAPALEPCAKAVARVGANVAGPLITGFVLHALLEGQRQSVDQIHFLARDGQIMKRIADHLCAMFGCTIETHYTLVSRKALLLPSLLARPDRLSVLAANSAGTTVGRLLKQLEISSETAERLVVGSGLDCDTRIGGDEYGQQKVTELLGSIEANIDCAIEEESNAFRNYLEKNRVLAAKRILVVDVGWKGNLQLRMQRAFGAMSVGEQPKIFGVYFGLTQVPDEIASRVNVFCERPPSGELIETFCAADHVSLSSYQDLTNSGEVETTMAPDERALAWGVKLQQDSMVDFASNLTASFRYAKPDPVRLVRSLKAAGLAAMNEFVQRPEPDDAETYGGMLHAPDADHIDFRQLAPKLSSVELAELFLPRRWRSRAEGRNWIEGSLTRSVPNAVARRAILNAWKIRSGKSRLQ
jgi:FMN phosphatase YigB (HAD superfamily)